MPSHTLWFIKPSPKNTHTHNLEDMRQCCHSVLMRASFCGVPLVGCMREQEREMERISPALSSDRRGRGERSRNSPRAHATFGPDFDTEKYVTLSLSPLNPESRLSVASEPDVSP
ncbi:unnamed protein product [Leuciscus chuanchicus]